MMINKTSETHDKTRETLIAEATTEVECAIGKFADVLAKAGYNDGYNLYSALNGLIRMARWEALATNEERAEAETNALEPTPRTLQEIADFFGCYVAYAVDDENGLFMSRTLPVFFTDEDERFWKTRYVDDNCYTGDDIFNAACIVTSGYDTYCVAAPHKEAK